MFKSGCFPIPINKILSTLVFPIILLSVVSCSKDYYPKQFPPVQSCPDMPVVIIDGEEYPTVLIENRCWMAKNLNIGTMISDSFQMTDNGVIEKYCYECDSSNCKIFGGLYQWDEIMQYKSEEGSRGICPEGWHIPTNRDFVDLVIYTDNNIGYLIDNLDSLWKAIGQSESYNLTGFSALPAGKKIFSSENSSFSNLNYNTAFWCSKEWDDQNAICLKFQNGNTLMLLIDGEFFGKKDGLSIRCIKDE